MAAYTRIRLHRPELFLPVDDGRDTAATARVRLVERGQGSEAERVGYDEVGSV